MLPGACVLHEDADGLARNAHLLREVVHSGCPRTYEMSQRWGNASACALDEFQDFFGGEEGRLQVEPLRIPDSDEGESDKPGACSSEDLHTVREDVDVDCGGRHGLPWHHIHTGS